MIDNALNTLSEPGSIALMTKKDFRISIDPHDGPVVPEPGMGSLFAIGLYSLIVRRPPHAKT